MAAVEPSGQQDNRRRTRAISLGGLCAACILLCLAAIRWLPTGNWFLYLCSSGFVVAAVLATTVLYGALAASAAGLTGLALLGLPTVWPFLFFFGPFPILRAWTDRRFSRSASRVIRVAGGTILALGGLWLLGRNIWEGWQSRLGAWLPAAAAGAVLIGVILTDLALGLMIVLAARLIRRPA